MKYVRRTNEGIMVRDKNVDYIGKGLKQYINELCLNNLSTFEGRERAAQQILKKRSVIPVYIDDENFLFPSESIRNYDCVYINYHEVLNIEKIGSSKTRIVFFDFEELILGVSYSKINKQMVRVQLILKTKNNMKINEKKMFSSSCY